MEKKSTAAGVIGGAASIVIIALFAAVLIFPAPREVFKSLSSGHPYIMGFVKFALLATVGEVLALRIRARAWLLPCYVGWRMLIWGLIGVAITFMMKTYSYGVAGMMEAKLLPGAGDGFLSRLLKAFYTAAVMNLTFGPTFMATHKCTDKYLELRHEGVRKPGLKGVVNGVDWHSFVSFTLFKTIPLFWIPAHTLTFLLPAEYQVIAAAALSIALGLILSLKK
ncbi:MAG: hypothetical protein J5586_03475 [Clostridia bacterium]|nr:hypothetical protein [Clostridia bacterium]